MALRSDMSSDRNTTMNTKMFQELELFQEQQKEWEGEVERN